MSCINAKRVMIAAPASGSGKTTVTCALLEALKERGLDPVSYKCGPDYIDPLFHKKVLNVDGRNLDTYFAGKDGVRRSLSACGDRYAVIEGVMGIYDGTAPWDTAGSCYETAALTDTPIILAVDAKGVGRTVISMIRGILADDTKKLIKGVILNKISKGFYGDLKPVLEKELSAIRDDVRLLGCIPICAGISIKSRHLGLMLPGQIDDISDKIKAAAALLEKNTDMTAIVSIMESAKKSTTGAAEDHTAADTKQGPVLAVALDDAFCFYYKDNLELFEKKGVRIRYFSPLHDERLPDETAGILIGGGYPEYYLKELGQNRSMLTSIREAISAGIPSLAECGGFMYLHESVYDMEQNRFEMVGVCEGDCFYTGHTVRFGYMMITDINHNAHSDELLRELVGMKGHEFHYYDSTVNGDAAVAQKPGKEKKWDCLVAKNNGIWGFAHFYYASGPGFIDKFIEKMKEVQVG